MRQLLLLLTLFSLVQTHAKNDDLKTIPADRLDWIRLEIPQTKCGDGSTYAIFIDEKALAESKNNRSRNVIFMFDAGGVCFDKDSCSSGDAALSVPESPQPRFIPELQAITTGNDRISPFANYSKVFFPYCTADVYLGNHKANYEGLEINHFGRSNIEKSLNFLKRKTSLFDFSKTENITAYGYSAGALGVLYHIFQIEKMFPLALQKSLISDAPGLHWGPTFWHQFPPQLLRDFSYAFSVLGHTIDRDNGAVANIAPKLCHKLPDWNFGFLQSSQDIVMSLFFGRIGQQEHHKLAVGPTGLAALTANPSDNCMTWMPFDASHTYLHMDDFAIMSVEGKSAMDFAWDVAKGRQLGNYLGIPELPTHSPANFLTQHSLLP